MTVNMCVCKILFSCTSCNHSIWKKLKTITTIADNIEENKTTEKIELMRCMQNNSIKICEMLFCWLVPCNGLTSKI